MDNHIFEGEEEKGAKGNISKEEEEINECWWWW